MARGHWILKADPDSYGFAHLLADRRTRWDGVRNAQALGYLRAMRAGDEVLVYHSGAERALVGLARVASAPYPDPAAGDPKVVVVDVEAVRALPAAVPLATIRTTAGLATLGLVRQPRLSVVPVTAPQWARLARLAGL